jgi:hypothetical protein
MGCGAKLRVIMTKPNRQSFQQLYSSSIREMRPQEREKVNALGTASNANEGAPLSASTLEYVDDDFDEVKEDPEGTGDKGFASFTRSLFILYL